MLRSLQTWLYDRDAVAPLAWGRRSRSIKARLAGGERVFETLIRAISSTTRIARRCCSRPIPDMAAEGSRRGAGEAGRRARGDERSRRAGRHRTDPHAEAPAGDARHARGAGDAADAHLEGHSGARHADPDRGRRFRRNANLSLTICRPPALSISTPVSTCAGCPPTCCLLLASSAGRCSKPARRARISSRCRSASDARPAASAHQA